MLNFGVRRGLLVGVVLGIALTTGACGARPTATAGEVVILTAPPAAVSTVSVVPEPTPAPSPAPGPAPGPGPSGAEPMPIDPNLLVAAAQKVEPNTTLGAVVFDRTLKTELVAVNADRQFSSASLVKLMIAIDVLDQGADADDRRSLARMLSVSDDQIASAFWVKGGGSAIIERVTPLIGLQGTAPPDQPGRWGEVQLTAHDMLRVYLYVMGLPTADYTLIVDALAQAPEYAADDWDQWFGIPDGLNLQWAIKQGWGDNERTMVLHSTGLVGAGWRYVVILLTEHPLGSGWRTSEGAATAAAAALNGLLPEA
jgi:hypothetical protein